MSQVEEVSGVRRLPMLEAGTGERKSDCANDGECLTRFVRSTPKNYIGPARCPVGCWAYLPTPQHVRHGLAHAFGRRVGQ